MMGGKGFLPVKSDVVFRLFFADDDIVKLTGLSREAVEGLRDAN